MDLSRRSGGESVRRVGLVEVMRARVRMVRVRVRVRLVAMVVSVIVIVIEEREVVTGGGHFRGDRQLGLRVGGFANNDVSGDGSGIGTGD